MSTLSHDRDRIALAGIAYPIGRPPAEVAPPRRCQGRTAIGTKCLAYASWLLPEFPYCSNHVPSEVVPLAVARARAWADLSTETWEHVLAQLPAEEAS